MNRIHPQTNCALTSLLSALRQQQDTDHPRYSTATCDWLDRLILTRSYASALLELSHWLSGLAYPDKSASNITGQPAAPALLIAELLTLKRVRSANLQALAQRMAPQRVHGDALVCAYSEGDFGVSGSRAVKLVALLDFLVSALYPALVDALSQRLQQPFNRKASERLANDLAKCLYDFLQPHLEPVQAMSKARNLRQWLRQHNPDTQLLQQTLDDPAVLGFWQGQLDDSQGDFRTFGSVADAFFRLDQALQIQAAEQAMITALRWGGDHEANEVELGVEETATDSDWEGAVDRFDDALAPPEPLQWLERLDESPACQIKFLNKQEREQLLPLCQVGNSLQRLPLTLLRKACFGQQQNRLTEALRRKETSARIAMLIDGDELDSYRDRLQAHTELQNRLQRTLLACGHALFQVDVPAALAALDAALGEAFREELREAFGDAGCPLGDAETNSHSLIAALCQSLSRQSTNRPSNKDQTNDDSPLADTLSNAEQAWKHLNRAGFKVIPTADSDAAEGFERGSEVLAQLLSSCSQAQRCLTLALQQSGGDDEGAAIFSADRSLFSTMFQRLYGSHHD
ncbi:hypothetical protein A9Q89_03700 [Gammaproteobacteria bacterium 53_120_T64]|nr:hypothetical protein A9Q89_03700 [Gammaproteobacteria bacterium 53_120_T64]